MPEVTIAGTYSIGEAADALGLSVHTLRFYETEGLLLGPVDRTTSGRRRYSQIDIDWLRICGRLRESQMPLAELKRFAELVRAGPGNEADRLDLLNAHRTRVNAQMEALAQARDLITWKVTVYENKLRTGDADGLWDPLSPSADSGPRPGASPN